MPGMVDTKADGAQTQSPPRKPCRLVGEMDGQSAMCPVKQEGVLDDRGEGQKMLPEGVIQATLGRQPFGQCKQQALCRGQGCREQGRRRYGGRRVQETVVWGSVMGLVPRKGVKTKRNA